MNICKALSYWHMINAQLIDAAFITINYYYNTGVIINGSIDRPDFFKFWAFHLLDR